MKEGLQKEDVIEQALIKYMKQNGHSDIRVEKGGFVIACLAAVSFPFPGGDRTSERKNGRAKEDAWGEHKIEEKWGGGDGEGGGGGGGEKWNRLQAIPNILLNSVRPRTGSNTTI